MTTYLDLETYSEEPIKNGVWRYLSHPSTEVTLVSYTFDDEEDGHIWDLTLGRSCPPELEKRLRDPEEKLVFHNSHFDRNVINELELLSGLYIKPERICDTMVQALAHGLPGSLDKLSDIFGLPEDQGKMKEGKALLQFFCKPTHGKRRLSKDYPEKWNKFVEYAIRDTIAMRVVSRKLPRWNYPGAGFFKGTPSLEHELWCLDQRINDRGFKVDKELAEGAVAAAAEAKQALDEQTDALTQGEVTAATQRDKLMEYILKAYGVPLLDMRSNTLQRILDDPDLPQEVKELLALRLKSSQNTSSKYSAVLRSLLNDNRVRSTMQFCGAPATGRWAGRVFQPQNLKRPDMKLHEINMAIDAIKAGAANLLYSDVPSVLGNTIRGIIVASEGHKLVTADLKAIEGRGLAYLADESYMVDFYSDYDKGLINYDSYQLTYTKVIGGDPASVTKHLRAIGKVIELALGYGGGVAAFLTFAMVYHLDLEELASMIWDIGDRVKLNDCLRKYTWAKSNGFDADLKPEMYSAFEYVKQQWRESRPMTVSLWSNLASAFERATLYNKTRCDVGEAHNLYFYRNNHWMYLNLPSGRKLCFLQPKVTEKGLSFAGTNHYTRTWGRLYTHGGKLSGLLTQAFARDILAANMPRIEKAGYPIVLTVHDEVITEPVDSDEFSVDGLIEQLTYPVDFAEGFPLAAEGYEAMRYRKD